MWQNISILDAIFCYKALVEPSIKSIDCDLTCLEGVDKAKKKVDKIKTPIIAVFLLQFVSIYIVSQNRKVSI